MRFLFLATLIANSCFAFGQANSPHTWLRVLGHPVMSTQVERLRVEEHRVDPKTYELLDLRSSTEYVFYPSRLLSSIYEELYSDKVGNITVYTTFVYDSEGFLQTKEQTTTRMTNEEKTISMLDSFYSINGNHMIEFVTPQNDDGFIETQYTIDEDALQVQIVVGTHTEDNAFFGTIMFDSSWRAYRKEAFMELNGVLESIATSQTDESGLTSWASGIAGKMSMTAQEWDVYNNPSFATKIHEGVNGSHEYSVVFYEYEYFQND